MKHGLALINFALIFAAVAGISIPARAAETRESISYGETSEQQLPTDQTISPWQHDPAIFADNQKKKDLFAFKKVNRGKICRTETVCMLRYKEGSSQRARIKNLVAPLQFDNVTVNVPDDFMLKIRQALMNLNGQKNITLHFIAHTDDAPLTERNASIYGGHFSLSKAVAQRVSLAVKNNIASSGITFTSVGKGATHPISTNTTPQGRALNRRVEVEFWYDDPLQGLPDEPQLCPEDDGAETVIRTHTPLQGGLEPILFIDGEPVIPNGYIERLQQVMQEVADKDSVRLRFIGYTGNARLDRRTASIYGDDIGLSTARARRTMQAVAARMGLSTEQAEFEGRGFVHSNNLADTGFLTSQPPHVQVQVVYDELIALDKYDDIDVSRMTREVRTINPFELNQMRISVDGKPVDDPGKSIPDVQRCTDVALDNASIAFKYNNLQLKPRLNITAWPNAVAYRDLEETDFAENLVHFRLYTNYHGFIERSEVRIFENQQSERDTPLAIIALDQDGRAEWQPEVAEFTANGYELKYLARVYDRQGKYDETALQPLWVVDRVDPTLSTADREAELLVGYGESRLASQNIQLTGGTVQATGSAIPKGHGAWLAGYPVPVDAQGRFVAEEILPEGIHSVEVALLDSAGNGELFLRDLELKKSDWFTVGIADLTLSANRTNGAATLLAPDTSQYNNDIDLQGRLAFYTKGKFGDGWNMTASADTREGPVNEIFSNFLDKSPGALFRRIDPDYHYPTYGDDSTVEEDAPTLGKFYLKLKKEENHALWGNFKINYSDNDLAQVDRGLYGANLHYQSRDATSFGAQRFYADGFAAEPGTVAERDQFRGTGGSLYYLRHQDILIGSDRVRIEIRDKDSGNVLEVKNLSPTLDYEIDTLQGRLLLTQPLSPTADDSLLIQNSGLSGNPVYLVVRYEYSPGLDDPDTFTTGGRMHYWFGDHLKLGMTADRDEEAGDENRLAAVDMTLRRTANTWLKLQAGHSEGGGQTEASSVDGGFNFYTPPQESTADSSALAYSVDGSLDLNEILTSTNGRMTFYLQNLEAGYSAPGRITSKDTSQYGGTLDLPVNRMLHLYLKGDLSLQNEGLKTANAEVNLDTILSDRWTLGSGIRYDKRSDASAVVPATQEQGDRTDAVMRLTYDSRQFWSAYGYTQLSLQTTGTREENDRLGAGGSVQLTDRLKATGEVSIGDLGPGGQLGTEYLYSDRSTLYLNYALENERSDNGLRARKGNLVSGFRTRYSDSVSVFLEERYTHGDVPTGLMHSTGIDLAPTDRFNVGANLDLGTLVDHQTSAKLERTAVGVSAGYGFDQLMLASAVEYRADDTEQPDTSITNRTTWLLKNSLKYQLTPSGRLIGKFNYSQSESSQGSFYDGHFTEAVIGYAYRPVNFDNLNALVKYTYFYNVPTVDQVTATDTVVGFIQRSHIAAIDVMYDLTNHWTLGGKYAYRQGDVSQDRETPAFFANRAHLYVLRADWNFLHSWDALIEGRRLDLPDAKESRDGALMALYRHVGNHLKVGLGYNFSNFSDDLTDLSYQHQGLFVNMIGTM